jgi:hypothetical protein
VSGGGHGPFGSTGFRAGLGFCVVAIAGGLAMLLLADGAVASAGTALLVLGLVGAATVILGLVAERLAHRRGRPPAPRL